MAISTAPSQRLAFIDQIRVALTVLVVFHHTAITYGGAGGWYYKEASARHGHDLTVTLLTLFCAINQAYFMGAFFLLAGYVTPPAYDRKGRAAFLRDRVIRLVIPLLVFAYVLDALTNAIAAIPTTPDGFMKEWLLGLLSFSYQPGPLWFVQTLLIFAFAYGVLRWLRPATPANDLAPLPRHRMLLLAALGTGAAAFALRLVMPVGQEWAHMQIGYYASYVLLFIVGCVASRHQWLARIEWSYARRWWIVALVSIPVLPAAVLTARALLPGRMNVDGGWNLAALLYAFWEPFVAWGVLLALLWFFRTRVAPERWRGWTRRAYAIYCFHPPVVVGISIALRAWMAPPVLKFLVVGSSSCAVLYVLTGWLVRMPGLRRIW